MLFCLITNAPFATVLGLIPASVGTVESEGGRWNSAEYCTEQKRKNPPKSYLKKKCYFAAIIAVAQHIYEKRRGSGAGSGPLTNGSGSGRPKKHVDPDPQLWLKLKTVAAQTGPTTSSTSWSPTRWTCTSISPTTSTTIPSCPWARWAKSSVNFRGPFLDQFTRRH